MKARQIDLAQAWGVDDAMRRIAIVRFAEVLAHSQSFRRRRMRALHDFRIACKRLRYALERFAPREPSLVEATVRLAQIQEALGQAHDCSVLASRLPPALGIMLTHLRREHDSAIDRAEGLWRDGFTTYGPFAGLVRFTGLVDSA